MAGYPDSYYAATANPAPERPALAGEATADVCVVGAGFTGLSAALDLAEKGYQRRRRSRRRRSAGARRGATAGRSSTG